MTKPLTLNWLREPIVDPNTGHISRGFRDYLVRVLELKTGPTLTTKGQINAAAPVSGRSEGIGTTVQNVDFTGKVTATAVANINQDNISDGTTFARTLGTALTGNQVDLAKAGVVGRLGSGKINNNVMLNYSNNATVDSIDNGTNATIRVYGTGGVGSTWHQLIGSAVGPENAFFSAPASYNTDYIVYFDGTIYHVIPTTLASQALADGILFAAKLHTVSAGGGGGASGGGGSSGGGGGRLSIL